MELMAESMAESMGEARRAELMRAGLGALARRDLSAAARRVERALALAPDYGEGWNVLGVVCVTGGDLGGAERRFGRAARCAPDNPAYVRSLAESLKRQGRAGAALDCLGRAVRRRLLTPDLLCDLADLVMADGRVGQSLPLYRLALVLAPDHGRALNNHAEALTRARRPGEAAVALRRLAVARGGGAAWSAAGAALVDDARVEEGVSALRRAAALEPADAAVWGNLGYAALRRHRVEAGERRFLRGLRLDPDQAELHVGLGTLRMLTGRLREGAASYEWRRLLPLFQPARRFERPEWDGRVLPGRTLLIHADRGHGDAIQFIRYAPLLRARGMRVAFAGPRGLLDLFRASDVADAVCEYDGDLPDHDVQLPVMSLIHRMGTDLDGIPAAIPYLRPPDEAARRWAARLDGLAGLRVGLVWAGSAEFWYSRIRSPGLEALLPLTDPPGASVVSLQVGPGRRDLQRFALPPTVLDLGPELRDFADTAAVIAGLDVVISPDTAVAHLAGALGRPVAVLLDDAAEWRWLRGREDSPWYPTAKLYRQSAPGDWGGPVERLRGDLELTAAVKMDGEGRA